MGAGAARGDGRGMPDRRPLRPEIQGLRAVAVALVVVHHLWPGALPGGFVGVDVFFAISGYLITAHLLREIDRHGRVRLGAFWVRRARRILPAALLVLGCSLAATLALVPSTYWPQYVAEIRASTLYGQNWHLAAAAVDYFAAEDGPSPVRHFWSLSAEEQFYLVWPVLLLVAALASRGRRAGLALAIGGVHRGQPRLVDPPDRGRAGLRVLRHARRARGSSASARCWPSAGGRAPAACSWLGLGRDRRRRGAVLARHAVPGHRGAAAGRRRARGDRGAGAAAARCRLGAVAVARRRLLRGLPVALAAAGARPVRRRRRVAARRAAGDPRAHPARRLAHQAPGRGPAALPPWCAAGARRRRGRLRARAQRLLRRPRPTSSGRSRVAERASAAVLASRPACFGAAARDPRAAVREPAAAAERRPDPAAGARPQQRPVHARPSAAACSTSAPSARARAKATETIALIGDSHASHWRAAVDPLAERRGWRGVSITHSGCPLTLAVKDLQEPDRSECLEWNRQVLRWLQRHREIHTSSSRRSPAPRGSRAGAASGTRRSTATCAPGGHCPRR